MKIYDITVRVNIDGNARVKIIRPLYMEIHNKVLIDGVTRHEKRIQIGHNVLQLLQNAYEFYVYHKTIELIDEATNDGVIPSLTFEYQVSSGDNHVSCSCNKTYDYIEIPEKLMKALSDKVSFDTYFRSQWYKDLAKVCGLHIEALYGAMGDTK
jgi:uncharacterized membrane protein